MKRDAGKNQILQKNCEGRMCVKKYSILLIISILSIMLIAGCGGGGGSTGVIPNNGSVTTIDPTATPGTLVEVPGNPTATPGSTIPSNLPTGAFKVEVQFPGSGSGLRAKDLAGSDLPYNSHTLRVTITGEAIATSIVGERNDLDPTGAGTYTLTVSNVPVGLNTANIQVLDPSGNILCQRKHGFYMTPGTTEGPGLILLGVAIDSNGACNPSNIDLPAGTTIAFQNQDYVNDRSVKMNSSALTIGPIGKATHITQPVTAEVYQSVNQLFNTEGTFTYDSSFGAPGRVLVYGLPTLTSITPDKDSTNGTTSVGFTLTGTNFGTSQASVNGEVKFIQVQENDPNNPWGTIYTVSTITSWANTSIAGSINLPEGKYRIEVKVRGENTTEAVYFYKGTGNYQVIVGGPQITGFSPAYGVEGDTITITGNYFSTTPSENVVKFNGVEGTTLTATATQLTVSIPSGATSGLISVSTISGTTSTSSPITVWLMQSSGTTSNLKAVRFVSASTGWAVGDNGTVLKTTNEGNTWTSQSLGTSENLSGICYANGNNIIISAANGQTLYKTTDGGNNWSSTATGKSNVGFTFGDMNTGWYITGFNTVYKSVDGGSTWNTVNTGMTPAIYGLYPYNANIVWVMGDGGVRATTDGTNWSSKITGSGSFTVAHFISATEGFVAGWQSKLRYTNDGGSTWTVKNSGLAGSDRIDGVMAFDANYLWLQNSGANISMTANGGSNWKTIASQMNSWYMVDSTHAWAVRNNGKIFRYTP